MNPLFMTFSVAYISGIFLLADSPVVYDLASYNPYSLLHIPLYAILTLVLVLTFLPFKGIHFKNRAQMIPKNIAELNNSANWAIQIDRIGKINLRARLLIAGLIAVWVAIADELHQSFIPSRHASITDVFLDVIGISFVMFFVHKLSKNRF